MSLQNKAIPPDFEYHWPADEEWRTRSNWFINFETNMVWVDAAYIMTPLIISSNSDGVNFNIEIDGAITYAGNANEVIVIAYNNFLVDKILLV